MIKPRKSILLVLAFLSSVVCLPAQSIESQLDSILSSRFAPSGPGATALVAKAGEVIYRKSIGLANVELGLKMKPDQVFRIASLTKQFTAAAILKLAEEDKLALSDDVRKYVPDFLPEGPTITIRHLLSHTSGIKNYAHISNWDQRVEQTDLSPEAIVGTFKHEPLAFQPGDQFLYSNLGYDLLGYIIEQVSGVSYQEYLRQTFFEPLNLNQTSYDQTEKLIPGRIPGYSRVNGEYVNATHLDMRLPFAAGGLISSVDDIKTWHEYIFSNNLPDNHYLADAHRPFELNDGRQAPYGYGWRIGQLQGEKSVKHDGIINGFVTVALYLPEHEILVALFSNGDWARDIEDPASEMAAVVLGKPFTGGKKVHLADETLKSYQGIYTSPGGQEKQLTFQDGQLMFHDMGGSKQPLTPLAKDRFKLDQSLTYLDFYPGEEGQSPSFILNTLNLPEQWVRTSGEVTALQSIPMSNSESEKFIGKYDFPGVFTFEVVRIDGKIYGRVGHDQQEILPYQENQFFALAIDARLIFDLDANGEVQGVKLIQNREMQGNKID